MQSFLQETLKTVLNSYPTLSNVTFILPSQRAGSALKHIVAQQTDKAQFLPEILSIENFIQEISTLEIIDNTTSIFKLYESYLKITEDNLQEDFETFSGWAQTIIQDFNEIDRYLINAEEFFNYLSLIKDKDHWFLSEEKTVFIENYLAFWKQLPQLYKIFKADLIGEGQAYQGLAYRVAVENVKKKTNNTVKYIFLGFNALNNAEQYIIQYLKKEGLTEVYWDLDNIFYKDTYHDASHFLRHYYRTWKGLKDENYQGGLSFVKEKQINIIGTPKKIGQAKAVGTILAKLSNDELSKTAVILGDESLLLPILNSIPNAIKDINITMGLPLQNVPLSCLFELLFQNQLSNTEQLYYKTVLEILQHPSLQNVFSNYKLTLSKFIYEGNITTLSFDTLIDHVKDEDIPLVTFCFKSVQNHPKVFISNCLSIIQHLKSNLGEDQSILREYLFRFNVLFNKLKTFLENYSHVTNISVLHSIYKDMLSMETLDFIGKKHDGLQLMGVLETRVLDFENIIITSVNEGILPSGKSNNSYLPYDLKREYGLPTYKEKDAVYTYHFYHMLQRAKNIHIIYNTEAGDLNSGEKSRFITQLEVESKRFINHTYNHKIYVPKVPQINSSLLEIKKTPQTMVVLKERAKAGFSPSALTTYIRNPIDFYNRYILGVRETEEVEETVAYNTLGTVVHDTLETLYKPYIGELLNSAILEKMHSQVNAQVAIEFNETYSKSSLDKGKNLLIFEVAKRYIQNFINAEKKRLKNGDYIEIVALEKDNYVELSIDSLDFPVFLRGKVDRIERANNVLRIIDYKTGKVESSNLKVDDWSEITSDYDKFSKPFQILQYAYMMHLKTSFTEPIEAGIISFKNLKSGFLPFNHLKSSEIDSETFEAFETQLKALITEICDPNIPFIEKEIKEKFF